jgi:hypothetical protein
MYGKLFADLCLPPAQSNALADLILKRMPAHDYLGSTVTPGDMNPSRAELVQQAKEESDRLSEQIKQTLGDYNYAQFQTYEKTLDARATLINFGNELPSGTPALTLEQEEQLIQAMAEEQQGFKFSRDLSAYSEDELNQYLQQLNQLDQRYLARAQSILSPDQFSAFKEYLTDGRERYAKMLRLAAKMATMMYTPPFQQQPTE